jgi:hypothetical protein
MLALLYVKNFVEFYKGEVRRIPLPRTPVNKGKRAGTTALPSIR